MTDWLYCILPAGPFHNGQILDDSFIRRTILAVFSFLQKCGVSGVWTKVQAKRTKVLPSIPMHLHRRLGFTHSLSIQMLRAYLLSWIMLSVFSMLTKEKEHCKNNLLRDCMSSITVGIRLPLWPNLWMYPNNFLFSISIRMFLYSSLGWLLLS